MPNEPRNSQRRFRGTLSPVLLGDCTMDGPVRAMAPSDMSYIPMDTGSDDMDAAPRIMRPDDVAYIPEAPLDEGVAERELVWCDDWRRLPLPCAISCFRPTLQPDAWRL